MKKEDKDCKATPGYTWLPEFKFRKKACDIAQGVSMVIKRRGALALNLNAELKALGLKKGDIIHFTLSKAIDDRASEPRRIPLGIHFEQIFENEE